jgi:hypothetical protein
VDATHSLPHMTVSQVLGAHAAVQIALAQTASRFAQPPVRPAAGRAGSFTESWASVSMCIGWSKLPGA